MDNGGQQPELQSLSGCTLYARGGGRTVPSLQSKKEGKDP